MEVAQLTEICPAARRSSICLFCAGEEGRERGRWCARACYSPFRSGASETGKSLPPAMLLLTRLHYRNDPFSAVFLNVSPIVLFSFIH